MYVDQKNQESAWPKWPGYIRMKLGDKGHELEKFRVGVGWEVLRGATLGASGREPEGQHVPWKGKSQHT